MYYEFRNFSCAFIVVIAYEFDYTRVSLLLLPTNKLNEVNFLKADANIESLTYLISQ